MSNDSPTEAGDGNTQPQDLTPAQQHQQYLGETKPELTPFPEIDWNGFSVPGTVLSLACTRSISNSQWLVMT